MVSITKAHWECWSECNLHCGFCYRMKEVPLQTQDALRMIEKLKAAGIRDIAFAGGDPSIRPDIVELILFADSIGFNVEVQTNAHIFERVFSHCIQGIDLFGFSLDGSEAWVHDGVRGTRGNFDRVLYAIDYCEQIKKPYVVRSVATPPTMDSIAGLSGLLENKKYLKKWSLLQFSAIGEGFANRDEFAVADSNFLAWADAISSQFTGKIDVYPNAAKGGVYFLIKPNGDVYSTESNFEGEEYVAVGNVLIESVENCLSKLAIIVDRHINRYDSLM